MTPIPPVPGACCARDGSCTTTLRVECPWQVWTEGLTCDPNRCPIPPIASALGSRYLSVIPQSWESDELIAIRISIPPQPACLGQYSAYISIASGITTFNYSPVFLNASEWGSLSVTGAVIVPGTTYEIQTETALGRSYPVTATTFRWGDVVPPFNPPSTTQQPDATDVVGQVDRFKHLPGASPLEACDLYPQVPDQDVNASDISMGVDAFKQRPYPFWLPCP